MKKLMYFLLAIFLFVLAIGGTMALLNRNKEKEPEIVLKEGETLLTDPADFEVNKWYRFYFDKENPESEAYIILNLVEGEGDFKGGFTEPGKTVEVDMSSVKIGVSSDYTEAGYIYWNDDLRLQVDVECGDGEGYFEIYLEENVFTGAGDNKTTPSIWFELTQKTQCLEIVCEGGAYIVVVDKAAE